jgi:hypothetical protein
MAISSMFSATRFSITSFISFWIEKYRSAGVAPSSD